MSVVCSGFSLKPWLPWPPGACCVVVAVRCSKAVSLPVRSPVRVVGFSRAEGTHSPVLGLTGCGKQKRPDSISQSVCVCVCVCVCVGVCVCVFVWVFGRQASSWQGCSNTVDR